MKAIIMAGGEGTRLRPLTCTTPKPMVPIMNKPVMEHIISHLKQHKITDIGATLLYMPQSIREYFGDGAAFGVKMCYFEEKTPLGTAGSVKNAGDFLDDDFLVISGDSITDINLTEAIEFHREKKAAATLVLTRVELPLEYGVVVTGKDGRIQRFLEKPAWSEVFSDTVNTGIYILSPAALSEVSKGQNQDFAKDLFPALLAQGAPLYGYIANGYWCDIGDLNVYRHCHYDVFDKKINLPFTARLDAQNIYLEEGAIVEEGAKIVGPALIGRGAKIKSGAVIDGYTVVGARCVIGAGASLKRTVLWDGCTIGRGVQLRGALIGSRVSIKDNASVFEQSVIGEASIVGAGATIKPAIKIWPYKNIGDGEILTTNLIWGTSHTKNIFGRKGIMGEVNVDITPEFASRIGAAFGAFYPGGKLGIAADGSAPSAALKHSFVAGLMSAGAAVFDFGDQPLPITRSGVRFYGLDGGVHVAVYKTKGDMRAYIDFLNFNGANLSRNEERKLEGIFRREDFIRSEPEDIKEIGDIYEYKLYYLRELINSTHTKDIGFKLLIQSSVGWGQRLASSAAVDLKCDATILKDEIDLDDAGALSAFAAKVRREGCDLGAVFDRQCEEMVLADNLGRLVGKDLYTALAALIVMREHKGATIAASVSAPSVIDLLASKYGARVKRTKESPLELMAALFQGPLMPEMRDQFVLQFDAVGGIIKIIDFLKKNNLTLSQLIDEIPEFHIKRLEVGCPFSEKGRVIKSLVEENENKGIELLDGVKINEKNGWVLVLPDSARPVCQIVGEGANEEYAAELAAELAEKVRLIAGGK